MTGTNPTLMLPDELVLLLHKEDGAHYPGPSVTVATGAARVGELVLRSRVALEGRKLRVTDQSPTGLAWADALLAEFAKRSGDEGKPVDLSWWLSFELGTFSDHRDVLVENGLLRKETKKFLGLLKNSHFYPDEVAREAALTELTALARGQREPDNRTALLGSIAHASGLDKSLGFTDAERDRLDALAKGENLGGLVESTVKEAVELIATTMVMVTTLPGTGE
ncbi:GOLPH3/VPS74 family protein [Prauserella flavalba]|uniref:GOLPH3/VPS74 family protein n=1 Tax=Prauserella flavalba TaxID=1477506 RepID=UPI0036F04F66